MLISTTEEAYSKKNRYQHTGPYLVEWLSVKRILELDPFVYHNNSLFYDIFLEYVELYVV